MVVLYHNPSQFHALSTYCSQNEIEGWFVSPQGNSGTSDNGCCPLRCWHCACLGFSLRGARCYEIGVQEVSKISKVQLLG